MIYVFVFEPCYFKIGACITPYDRVTRGFWMNVHPPALCGRLDTCRLYRLFEGDLDMERAIHAILRPDHGEFYALYRLVLVIHLLEFLLPPHGSMPLPTVLPICRQRRVCCGSYYCGYGSSHAMARADATKGRKAACSACGTMIALRRDKQNEHMRRCASMRSKVAG